MEAIREKKEVEKVVKVEEDVVVLKLTPEEAQELRSISYGLMGLFIRKYDSNLFRNIFTEFTKDDFGSPSAKKTITYDDKMHDKYMYLVRDIKADKGRYD